MLLNPNLKYIHQNIAQLNSDYIKFTETDDVT